MVHLPYFWSQKAIHTLEPPEVAQNDDEWLEDWPESVRADVFDLFVWFTISYDLPYF